MKQVAYLELTNMMQYNRNEASCILWTHRYNAAQQNEAICIFRTHRYNAAQQKLSKLHI